MRRLAILDDVLRISPRLVDWSKVAETYQIQVFDRNLSVPEEAAVELEPFEVICCLRERMSLPRALLEGLPNLKLICVTGPYHRTLDLAAATELGIVVSYTEMRGPLAVTCELSWAHLLALTKNVALEDRRMRAGGWQSTVGMSLTGKVLGLCGLGRVGRQMVQVAKAFDMTVHAWSSNLTAEKAAEAGTVLVSKEDLFRKSDIVSVHLVLSDRSRHTIGAREIAMMKPSAYLINTARGPLVDEEALIAALQEKRIAGAGLDVFHVEPLPPDHPLRKMDNVVVTPHLGFSTEEIYKIFWGDTAENVEAFIAARPIRVLNPDVLGSRALRRTELIS
ncbi:D-2-hydroxyacid dehydrogenase family protein [Bradyrhizobium commune]|uniref:D-2-hydroxyacid dehydrogenase family protein n=2 Tax=Bradyrhizobium commune TaxID=83627 RepID=A0A7S9DCR1_9BRAD|nr:D-2-hydroxyacid dehydrogenase family protein [Bradyrhizobium commune]